MLTTGLMAACGVLGGLLVLTVWVLLGKAVYLRACEIMLDECEWQFRNYAELHYMKGTIESITKGNVNRDFADRIAALLGDEA